ncbi:DNA primase/helicase [Microbacterium phage SirVictor]|nr:DNA primase/helicase [Microbacterium phage SirVictor]
MDINPLELIRKVWGHSGIEGNVWVPHIVNIGSKDNQKFREGPALTSRKPQLPELRDSVDWYWTPAVSSSDSRRAKEYPAQRALWVDCDESFNDELLTALRPSYVWETSPGHKQAIWLMRESIPASEYHRDGLMGMLTQALGGDKSGVDIGQLLRVPGTWHHKRKPFQGRVLASSGRVYTRGQLLTRVAKGLGFSPGLASELGADDPFGDRSKVIWKVSRNAAELGLPLELAFKLLRATKWNKFKGEDDRLREDVGKAYAAQPADAPTPTTSADAQSAHADADGDLAEEVGPWEMGTVGSFGPTIKTPMDWVLPNFIPAGGCGLLVAAPKVGKTRIAIEMTLGLATATQPLGVSTRKPQPVGFLSLEDGDYLFATRLNSTLNRDRGRFKYHWDGHIKPDMSWEPPQPMSLYTMFSEADLSTPEDQQRLLETILKYELRLVVIDTLSMAIGKANVSDSKDMYSILKPLKRIAQTTGCAIMFIHHTRKRQFEKGETVQETILGSTALHGWADFILSLASPEEEFPDFLRLAVQTKMGYNQHYLNKALKVIKETPQEES